MLRLEYHKSSEVTVLRCSGRIVRGDGAETLLRAVMSENSRHILIDLIEVDAIDAAGLGALAKLKRWSMRSSRTLRVLNPGTAVREALNVTGLSSVLNIPPVAAPKSKPKSPWQEFLTCFCPQENHSLDPDAEVASVTSEAPLIQGTAAAGEIRENI